MVGAQRVPYWQGGRAYEPYAMGYFSVLRRAEYMFIPAGTIHAVKNVGTGNAAELATYVVEKGKPLVVLVK